MRLNPVSRAALAAAIMLLAGVPSIGTRAEETPPPTEAGPGPETFTGRALVINGPVSDFVRFTARIERWSTPEERKALAEALRSKGDDGLVDAMEGLSMGRIQFEQNIAHPIRVATTWQTDKGRMVRLATNRPISFRELNNSTRSLDYPIGIMEFLLPPEGEGEGSLIGAVTARFDEQGRLEVKSLPSNTAANRLVGIEKTVEKPKKKKS